MTIEALKEQARRHEQKEEWAKALDQYLKAIERLQAEEQADIGLYNRVGDLQTRIGNLEAAVQHYEQAADLYMEAELPNNAIAICKKILRNMPNRALVFLRMGQIRASQGFLTDARQNFLAYAEQMQKEGNLEEAFRALIEFADLAPEDLDIRMAVASQLEGHGSHAEAVGQYLLAYQGYRAAGQEAEATAVADKVKELDPEAELPEDVPAGLGGDDDELSDFDLTSGYSEEPEFQTTTEFSGAEAMAVLEGVETSSEFEGTAQFEGASELDESSDFDTPGETDFTPEFETSSEFETPSGFEGLDDADLLPDAGPDDSEKAEQDSPGPVDEDLAAELDGFGLDESGEEALVAAETGEDDIWSDGAADHDEWKDGDSKDAAEEGLPPLPLLEEDDEVEEVARAGGEQVGHETDDEPEMAVGSDGGTEVEIGAEELDDHPHMDLDAVDEELTTVAEDVDEIEESSALPLLADELDGAIEEEQDEPDAHEQVAAAVEEAWEDAQSAGAQEEAVERLRTRVAENPADHDGWRLLGEELIGRGDNADGVEALERAHEGFAASQQLDVAMRVVRELVLHDPDNIPHHQRLVEYAHRMGDRTLLIPAYLELADCLDRTGESGKAQAVYQQVIVVDPGNRRASEGLHRLQAEPTPAAAGAVSSDYVDLGSMVLDDDKERSTRWTVAADAPSGDEEADFARMLSQFKAKVAENLSSDDDKAHYDLGTAYKEMGLQDEAIAEFQQAIRANPNSLASYETLGQCFLEKGQPEIAVRSLEKALELPYAVEDERLGIYYYLGLAHEESGNSDSAQEFYEKVFALDINFQDVTERLRALR